jgi:hypothetical protein
MTDIIDQYFGRIAARAEQAVHLASPTVATPPIVDAPQGAKSTSWASRSVHPLQVLETSYVSVVQKAVQAAGGNLDLAREYEFEAMSGFYALSSAEPSLLKPDSRPLIDDRLRHLSNQMRAVKELQKAGSGDVYAGLVETIKNALIILSEITTAQSKQYAEPGIQDALTYIGLFPATALVASAQWISSHPNQPADLGRWVAEVEAKLTKPLLDSTNAAGSPRSLYNIEPFYLFRLMHRFVGGDSTVAMSLEQKGIASGEATGLMHPQAWAWMFDWHEAQIVQLDIGIAALSTMLQRKLNITSDPLRFHLKGGRAMNTYLGTPADGSNDWDTGILIDPSLPPTQWYQIFAAVNDLVVTYLDSARFTYTELLNEHAADLRTAPLLATETAYDPYDMSDFTKEGLLAEHCEATLRNGAGNCVVGDPGNRASLIGTISESRPSGVNGELIDIGIATRSSVELREHWADMTIIKKTGLSGASIPVPTAAYFIDDFTTMIREAIATDTVGRKLAKRLRRLHRVLASNGADLITAVALRQQRVTPLLPKTFTAIGNDETTPDGRLKIWLLDAMMGSVPATIARLKWIAALDTYISAQAGQLFADAKVASMWVKLDAAFVTPAEKRAALDLLVIENAVSEISRTILTDAKIVAQAIGSPKDNQAALWTDVSKFIDTIVKVPTPANSIGVFYIGGILASRLQAEHSRLDPEVLMKSCAAGFVEMVFSPFTPRVIPNTLAGLQTRLNIAKPPGFTVTYDQDQHVISVSTSNVIDGRKIVPDETTVLMVRLATQGETGNIIDHMNNWPVDSTRNLIVQFTNTAAHSADFDIRTSVKKIGRFLLKNLLGLQLQ